MMQASIPTVELVNDHHHVYHVHVHYQPAGTTWVARHRYSEFYELHSSSGMPSTDTEFPPKLWFGNRDEGAVAERQKKLELWLRAAVSATGCYDVPAANRDASQRTAVALLDPFLQVDDQRLGLSSGPPSTPGVMAPSAFEPLLVGAPPQIAAAAKAAQNLAVGRGSVNEFISELSALKTLVENQSVQLDQMRLSLSSPQPSSPAGLLPPMHQTPSAADAAATDPVAGAAEAPAGANGPDSVVEKHLANHADELKALLQGPAAAAAAASAHIEEHRSDVAAANRAPRIGILGSTRGTNTLHIYDEIAAGRFNAQVAVVISNISKAQILERARAADVPAVHIAAKGRSREEFDAEVNSVLASHGVDIVLLVGFMRILSPVFCNAWKGRAVNVHPSLLPKHAALMDLEVHQSVLDAGDTESGCTVHMVDEVVDAGSIVLQPSVSVSGDDTAETLKSKVQALEAPALVEAVKIFAQNGMSFVKPGPRIGILGSTRGTNTLHIYDEIAAGRFNAQVAVVISNISKAQILERARAADVPAVHIAAKGRSREEFDAEVNSVLASHGVDIVLLVGFMRILSPVFCNAWKGRAVNVHPSLLPKHAALMDLEVHQSVLDAGDTESGCTVHMVDEVVDAGSIVLQPSVSVSGDDTAETLKSKVQALEAPALVEAVKIFAQNGMSFVKPASAAAAAATAEQPDKQQQVATEVLALGALQTREQYKQQQQQEAQSDDPWQNTTK